MDFSVEKYGFRKIKQFLSSNKALELNDNFLTERVKNQVQDPIIELKPEVFSKQFPKIYRLIEELMSDQLGYQDLEAKKVWIVYTTASDSDLRVLPYIPHFDRDRYLKVIIYLNDVNKSNGAFWACSSDVNVIEKRRRSLPDNYKARGLNSINSDQDFSPVEGQAGDAILFDTNCPHYAGTVENDKFRHILRVDFEKPGWNDHFRKSGIITRMLKRANKMIKIVFR